VPEAVTPELLLIHAELLADQRDWKATSETLEKLPTEYRRSHAALLLGTRTAMAGGQPAKAADYLNAVPASQQPETLRSELTTMLVDAGLFAKAAAFVPDSPTHPDALLVRAVNLAAAGQIHDAIQALQIPASAAPVRPAALWTLAQCHAAIEQRIESRDVLSRLLLIQPDHLQARLLRQRLALEQRDFDSAAADLSLLLKKEPENGEALRLQGALRLSTDRPLDALRDLTRMLQNAPQDSEACIFERMRCISWARMLRRPPI
jgi:uncharacterized protein HemY